MPRQGVRGVPAAIETKGHERGAARTRVALCLDLDPLAAAQSKRVRQVVAPFAERLAGCSRCQARAFELRFL